MKEIVPSVKRFIYHDLREDVIIMSLEDKTQEAADAVFQSCTRINPNCNIIRVEVQEIEKAQEEKVA